MTTYRTVWSAGGLRRLLAIMTPEQRIDYESRAAGEPVDVRCRVAARVLMGGEE